MDLINVPDLPESIDNGINNLLDEPTKELGKIIGDSFYLVFGGISYKADKKRINRNYNLEVYEKEIKEKLLSIPKEKLIQPDFQMIDLILENSKYRLSSDDIRRLFVNHLKNACHVDYKNYLHPAFSEIIKQMSPLDAQTIKLFTKRKIYPVASYEYRNSFSGSNIQVECVFLDNPNCQDIEIQSKAISSLIRLGLIHSPRHAYLDDKFYDKFYNTQLLKEIETERNPDLYEETFVNKKVCVITPIGEDFITVCCSD